MKKTAMILLLGICACTSNSNKTGTSFKRDPAKSAERMIRAGSGRLAPVYAPLAGQIVRDFNLSEKEGIGLDIGSGPGTLIIELCKHSRLYWINVDINPYFFSHFFRLAEKNKCAHRVGAVRADVQDLPFGDNYADVIVSRGSYHFWKDRKKGISEIYRVLKPGGTAYIGRGFPRDLPIDTARRIRAGQGKMMKYDRKKETVRFRDIMKTLGIRNFKIHVVPAPDKSDVNYGIWIEFNK